MRRSGANCSSSRMNSGRGRNCTAPTRAMPRSVPQKIPPRWKRTMNKAARNGALHIGRSSPLRSMRRSRTTRTRLTGAEAQGKKPPHRNGQSRISHSRAEKICSESTEAAEAMDRDFCRFCVDLKDEMLTFPVCLFKAM